MPGVFGNEQPRYLDLIKQMLQQSLMPDSGYDVRFQAVRAVGAFIILHDKDTVIHKHFADLLPGCLQVLAESIEKQDDTALLKVVIDLAESTPKFLRSELESIFQMCMKVIIMFINNSLI